MSDVKRFLAPTNDTCDMDSYQQVVLASDYDALLAERDQLSAELEVIRGQPSAALIEAVRELIGAANSVNRSRMHEVRGHDDEQPRYWQRKEWVDWLVGNGERAQQALDALPPQQPDAVSVPRELLESHLQQVGEYGWWCASVDQLRALLNTKPE